MPPYVWVDTGKVTALPDREEGVDRNQDPYGWYREGPIGADFKIDEVLPHLFEKSVAYVKERGQKEKTLLSLSALASPAYSNRSRASVQGCK